jgi:hypothetical protein
MNSDTLELRRESGDFRHYLAGKPIHAGQILEIKTELGWLLVRYEWSYVADKLPVFIALNPGDEESDLRIYSANPQLRWVKPSS